MVFLCLKTCSHIHTHTMAITDKGRRAIADCIQVVDKRVTAWV